MNNVQMSMGQGNRKVRLYVGARTRLARAIEVLQDLAAASGDPAVAKVASSVEGISGKYAKDVVIAKAEDEQEKPATASGSEF